jgi:hypothetical protein
MTGGGFLDEIGHARFKFCLLTISAQGDPKQVAEYSFFGLQWKDAPRGYRPHKTLYNRFIRWSRLGVFDRSQPSPAKGQSRNAS